MKVLANDGIASKGKKKLEAAGFEVLEVKVANEQLADYINKNKIDALLVRSATEVSKKIIEVCPNLKLIGRAGVGMDNIDVAFAKAKGIHVINTPQASSQSVAELVFAHIFTGFRYLQDANRNMPLEGDQKFKALKKSYANASELKGKSIGIIGFGRIGSTVAKIALGLGMKVIFHDSHHNAQQTISLDFYDGRSVDFALEPSSLNDLLKKSDIITIHLPSQKKYVIGKDELALMKTNAGLINTARGGLVDEVALIDALENDALGFAGLDVFENEPQPAIRVLMHPKISLSPHIGGSTIEAQERIAVELAEQLIDRLK